MRSFLFPIVPIILFMVGSTSWATIIKSFEDFLDAKECESALVTQSAPEPRFHTLGIREKMSYLQTYGLNFVDAPFLMKQLNEISVSERPEIVKLVNEKIADLSKKENPFRKDCTPYRALQFVLNFLMDPSSYFRKNIEPNISNLEIYQSYLKHVSTMSPGIQKHDYSVDEILSVAKTLQKVMTRVSEENGKMLIYGSVPNGFMKTSSDIDIMAVPEHILFPVSSDDYTMELQKDGHLKKWPNLDIQWHYLFEKQPDFFTLSSPLMLEVTKKEVTLLIYNIRTIEIRDSFVERIPAKLPFVVEPPLRLRLVP